MPTPPDPFPYRRLEIDNLSSATAYAMKIETRDHTDHTGREATRWVTITPAELAAIREELREDKPAAPDENEDVSNGDALRELVKVITDDDDEFGTCEAAWDAWRERARALAKLVVDFTGQAPDLDSDEDVCDECGHTIDPEATETVNDSHGSACSLYPRDTVGGGRS